MDIEGEVYDYVCGLNESGDMSIDIRFACLGDTNRFYSAGGHFVLTCADYCMNCDIEGIKLFISTYLTGLWSNRDNLYNRIALYIERVREYTYGYKISIGAALFEDPSITKD